MNAEKERQVMEDVIRTLDRHENENLPQVQLTKTEVHCSLLAPLFNHGRISSVVRALTVVREVAGSIPGILPVLKVLK